MRLAEKKKTIELLEKLRVYNKKSAYIYDIAIGREQRLILRGFYQRLYRQKLKFLREIEEMIDQLKMEISPIKDPRLLSFYKRKKCEFSKNYLKYKLKLRYADIQKRESKAYKKYEKYLSKTSHSCVRELFLDHKYYIMENLQEMNKTGVMKFPVA